MGLKEVFVVGLKVKGINIFAKSYNPIKQKKINKRLVEYKQYCVEKYSSENMIFLCEIQDLYKKQGKSPEDNEFVNGKATLQRLYNQYIVAGANDQVNVSAELVKKLKLAIDTYDENKKNPGEGLELFAEAAEEVRSLSAKDTFKRFKEGIEKKNPNVQSNWLSKIASLFSRKGKRVHPGADPEEPVAAQRAAPTQEPAINSQTKPSTSSSGPVVVTRLADVVQAEGALKATSQEPTESVGPPFTTALNNAKESSLAREPLDKTEVPKKPSKPLHVVEMTLEELPKTPRRRS